MIFLEIIIAILIGTIIGTFTGIIPGIHVNLVAIILLSISPILLQSISPITLGILIISISIIHTFLDTIPSTFLGAPEESTALAVLPAHKLLIEGRGYEAVRLTVIGSLLSLLFVVILSPLIISIVSFIYPLIKSLIGYILIGVISLLILREKNKYWSLVIFLLSGVLGIGTFNLNIPDPLFPMLSGLFGISTLILSYNDNTKIPPQNFTFEKLSKKTIVKATFLSTFSSSLCSFLPGIGSSQAAVLASTMSKKINPKIFLIIIGGIGSVNMFLSILGLYALNKARNGSIVIVGQILQNINLNFFILFIGVSLLVGGISVPYTLFLTKKFCKLISKLNYKLTCIFIMIFITSLTFYFSGFLGLLVLITSIMLGLLTPLLKVSRSHTMGCMILPVILYYLI